MTIAKRTRRVFESELFERKDARLIRDSLEQSGEKFAHHVESVVDSGRTLVRFSDVAKLLHLARGWQEPRLANVPPPSLGYVTTARRLQEELGLKTWEPVRQKALHLSTLPESHLRPCTTPTGAQDYELSALAAWLMVSLFDKRLGDKSKVLQRYFNAIP